MKYDSTEKSLTLYERFNEPRAVGYATMDDIVRLIKSTKFKEGSEEIRDTYAREKIPNEFKAEIEMLKKNKLKGVGFGGTFKHRKNEKLIDPSGLLVLDFDNGPCPEELNPYILLKFKSPRGRDKVVLRIPLVKNDSDYKTYFRGVEYFIAQSLIKDFPTTPAAKTKAIKNFRSPLDTSGSDVARFTYLSYDPEPYFNPNSVIWTQRFIIQITRRDGTSAPEPKSSQASELKTIRDILYRYGSLGSESRHELSLRAGYTAGGWVAGGLLNKDEVYAAAEDAISHINDGDEAGIKDDMRAFNDSFMKGVLLPMNESHAKNAFKKLDAIKPEVKIESDEDEIIKQAAEAHKIEHEARTIGGVLTGWDSLDQIYKVYPGTTTLVYSQPGIGKTLLLQSMAINISRNYDWNWFCYFAESGSFGDQYNRLAEALTGKDATGEGQMSTEERTAAIKWLAPHFLMYKRGPNEPRPSVEEILLACEAHMTSTGKKINGVIIDTLSNTTIDNEGDQKFKSIEAKYETMLDFLGQWTIRTGIHVFLTSHMINVGRIAVDKATGMEIDPFPHFGMIKGGQALPRMGYNIIALHQHRPATFSPENVPIEYNGKLYFNNSFYIVVQKVKPWYVGRKGIVHFRIDYQKHTVIDYEAERYVPEEPAPRDFTESAAQQNITFDDPNIMWVQ